MSSTAHCWCPVSMSICSWLTRWLPAADLSDEIVAHRPRLLGSGNLEVESHGTQVVAQAGERLGHGSGHGRELPHPEQSLPEGLH